MMTQNQIEIQSLWQTNIKSDDFLTRSDCENEDRTSSRTVWADEK